MTMTVADVSFRRSRHLAN